MRVFVLIIFIASVLMFVPETYAVGGCQSSVGGYCADLAIVLPGVEFLGDLGPNIDLGELLSRLYVFGIGITALAAFVFLTIGGVMYVTARDNQGQIGRAKDMMSNAIWGLAIALLSWLILFTINPDLVRRLAFKLPQLPPVPVGRGAASEGSPPPIHGTQCPAPQWTCSDSTSGVTLTFCFSDQQSCLTGCVGGTCTPPP